MSYDSTYMRYLEQVNLQSQKVEGRLPGEEITREERAQGVNV